MKMKQLLYKAQCTFYAQVARAVGCGCEQTDDDENVFYKEMPPIKRSQMPNLQ